MGKLGRCEATDCQLLIITGLQRSLGTRCQFPDDLEILPCRALLSTRARKRTT